MNGQRKRGGAGRGRNSGRGRGGNVAGRNVPGGVSGVQRTVPKFSSGAMGECILSHTELLTTLSSTTDTKGAGLVMCPGFIGGGKNTSPSLLNGIAQSFERYRFTKVNIQYRPSTGTTSNGDVSVGVDWNCRVATAVTDAIATSYYPNFSGALYDRNWLEIPKGRIMSRLWLGTSKSAPTNDQAYDVAPFALVWFLNTPGATAAKPIVAGKLWISYDIVFDGPRALDA